MTEFQIRYEGDLHCEAIHGPSKSVIHTDAPPDNNGKGELFSPTDLVATALGTCILTIMGIVARRHEVSISGATARVTKEMATAPVRRIGRLVIDVNMPASVPEDLRPRFEAAADTCPVRKSLHPDVEQVVRFSWTAQP